MFDYQKEVVNNYVDNITKNFSSNVHTAFTVSAFYDDDDEKFSKVSALILILQDYLAEGWNIEDPELFAVACRDADIDWDLTEEEIDYIYGEVQRY